MKPLHYPAGIGRVATEYVDAHGAVRQVSASTRDRLLAAMQPALALALSHRSPSLPRVCPSV